LVERLVGILTNECSGQRQPIVVILDVGLLFLQQAELLSKPEGLNELVLSSLLSLLERIFVEGEKVVEVVNVEAFDLLVQHDEFGEGIIVLVDGIQGVADAQELMLHREEAVSDHVETVSLDDRPFLDHLGFGSNEICCWVQFSTWHSNFLLVVDHLVESSHLDNLALLRVSFVGLGNCVHIQILDEGADLGERLEARGICVNLKSIFGDDEEGILVLITKRMPTNVGGAHSKQEPVTQLFHFGVITSIDTINENNRINV
jgi:hypothetical protein